MKTKQMTVCLMQSLLLIAFFMAGWTPALRGQDPSTVKQQVESAAAYKEFINRVQAFVSLHKSIESSLPSLKRTDLPEMITAHQQALARKIREARPNAKRGDIFSDDVSGAFRRTVRDEFRGPQGRNSRATIRQGEPLKEIHLHVNEDYPEGVPFTTVPPTLLLNFPKLPDQVGYRIVGRDLVLLDVEAHLVVDTIPEIIP
ncbi:MAG: hypothetical protein PVS2B2_15000 [Candidatus Acidiferrum sp.]